MTKPLSAEQAAFVRDGWKSSATTYALDAIATGQHQVIDTAESVAVKRRTEKEWRAEFDLASPVGGANAWFAWLSFARLVGAVIDEKEGG